MAYDESLNAIVTDALEYVRTGHILGLGSGRAATSLVRKLGMIVETKKISVQGVPTSLQIKFVAEEAGISLLEMGAVSRVDIVFDGADQIDATGYLIKGGGGALLRENVLASMAGMVIIMADETKFVRSLSAAVPVEVHPTARCATIERIKRMDGSPHMRMLDRGYPLFTENGNIILDCDFGTISDPPALAASLRQLPGVLEAGIFEKPDIIYKAEKNGRFDVIRSRL